MNNDELKRRMEEANALAYQQQQQQLLLQHQQQQAHVHRQHFLMLQQQFQQQQQQQQQHLSRFSGNPAILQSEPMQQQQQQRNALLHHNQLLQQQQQQKGNLNNLRQNIPPDWEMAQQDAWKVCHPDIKRPFSSLEDACERILPYHIFADYEAEDDDRILEDSSGQLSRSQLWDQNLLAKVGEFTQAFERQIVVFNTILKRRAQGDFRSEERLMIEQRLLHDEKQKLYEMQAGLEARKKAEENMRMAMAQAEQARAEANKAEAARLESARAEGLAKARAEEQMLQELPEQEHAVNMDDILHGWGTLQKEEDADPSEDFLNDEHNPDAGEDRGLQNMETVSANAVHEDWREVGKLDLNTR
eukprot:TRINITY_DN1250_c0_g1_i2.p1 TRINITY_DN1250_c0_g1~~TRINITY_DN1250_c0_g1_i2.p1  ORF type:complete len:359 (-),score=129.09 TRINITY_DN1250_c0_g1_i2:227-1303(-)